MTALIIKFDNYTCRCVALLLYSVPAAFCDDFILIICRFNNDDDDNATLSLWMSAFHWLSVHVHIRLERIN